jgi:NAD(P)-dependent dehydrogenase (short-subunit alcohol dehydrogenase family)
MHSTEKLLENYQPNDNCLTDSIIAVTGAGDGIGKVMAKAYAQFGATVILLGRTVDKLEATYDEIEAAGFKQPAIFVIDFETATETEYQQLADSIDEGFGRLDGLLHNAALLGVLTSIASYSVATWQQLMSVNVNAPFILTKKCLPLLQKSPRASIIFTGSSVGLKGRAYWGAYSISKAAIENLTQVLADELATTSNISVNSINPGATRTQMRASAFPAEDPQKVKLAESLVPLYLYLMDSKNTQANKVTGQQFNA